MKTVTPTPTMGFHQSSTTHQPTMKLNHTPLHPYQETHYMLYQCGWNLDIQPVVTTIDIHIMETIQILLFLQQMQPVS